MYTHHFIVFAGDCGKVQFSTMHESWGINTHINYTNDDTHLLDGHVAVRCKPPEMGRQR